MGHYFIDIPGDDAILQEIIIPLVIMLLHSITQVSSDDSLVLFNGLITQRLLHLISNRILVATHVIAIGIQIIFPVQKHAFHLDCIHHLAR